jgi:hypothetical protein
MTSTMYKLTDPKGVVIAQGSKRKMHTLRKQRGAGYKVWNSPGSKVGDKIGD